MGDLGYHVRVDLHHVFKVIVSLNWRFRLNFEKLIRFWIYIIAHIEMNTTQTFQH